MNFTTAAKVRDVLNASETIEFERSANRDKISRGINGFPPLSDDDAKKMGLKINVNWLEETNLTKQACLQYFNAFQSRNNYFFVNVPSMPEEKRMDWCDELTRLINKPLKESTAFGTLMDNRFSSVVAHGLAPVIWLSTDNWLGDFIALDDFRVATDTETSLSNLVWFGVRRKYTVGELVDRVFGKYADRGWNQKAIIKIIAQYWNKNWESDAYDWETSWEKLSRLVKQNMGFYCSDAVPVITLWHFYHLDDSNLLKKQWLMKVVPDKTTRGAEMEGTAPFLFESDKPAAKKLSHLLNLQVGDLTGTPPHLIHCIRSLGFMLHEVCFWMNLFRCRTFQHTWENFNMLWRSADGGPKARAQAVELFHKGYVSNDVSIIPREQRHQIDSDLVELVMGQARQLMGEVSASYTQEIDTGTKREQTLGEAQIKLQQSNAIMTGLLAVAARNEVHHYREIARRFCIRGSISPEAREFQRKAKAFGIPRQYLDVDLWEITPDMPLGSGNQTLEQAQAAQLMAVRAAHGPDAQQEILHIFDSAMTQNPRLAQRLAPLGKLKPVSNGQTWASSIFGTLMQGSQVIQQSDLNPIDQVQTLLGLSAGVVQRIMKSDNMGTPQDVIGLQTVFAYVGQLIARMEQDKALKLEAKEFADQLGKLSNVAKGFMQRQQEAMKPKQAPKIVESLSYKDAPDDVKRQIEAQAGLQPSRMAIPDPKTAKAVQGMQNKQAQFNQKQQQDAIRFQVEQMMKLMDHKADLSHEEELHRQQLAHEAGTKLLELLTPEAEQEKPAPNQQ